MTLKEIFKQTHNYAKPILWRVFGFNLLFYVSVMFLLSLGAIVIPMAHNAGSALAIILLIITTLAIFSGLIFIGNAVLAKLDYIIKNSSETKPTWGILWKNTYCFRIKNINLFAIYGVALIIFIVGIFFTNSLFHTSPANNGEPSIQMELVLWAGTLLFNLLVIPVFFISAIVTVVNNLTALHATKKATQIVFKNFAQLSLLPLGFIFIPTILLSIIFSLVGIPDATGEFIIYLLVLIIEPYMLSYYIINYQANTAKTNE